MSWTLWLVSFNFISLRMEEQMLRFEFLWVFVAWQMLVMPLYIVTVSMSTTKCFSWFIFMPEIIKSKRKKETELPNAWMLWTLTFWTTQRLKLITCMHEITNLAMCNHHRNFKDFSKKHTLLKWHPFKSEMVEIFVHLML